MVTKVEGTRIAVSILGLAGAGIGGYYWKKLSQAQRVGGAAAGVVAVANGPLKRPNAVKLGGNVLLGHHFPQDNAKRVDVRRGVKGFPQQHLGGHPQRRAGDTVRVLQLFRLVGFQR